MKAGIFITIFSIALSSAFLQAQTIAILWPGGMPKGSIEILNGKIAEIKLGKGLGKVDKASFEFTGEGESRLEVTFTDANTGYGSSPAMVTVNTAKNPFTFFLRDIHMTNPVYIPEYKVAVTEQKDPRTFAMIEYETGRRLLRSQLDRIEMEPEESYTNAAAQNRSHTVPTWLGISRDMRIFEVSTTLGSNWREAECITPRNASSGINSRYFDFKEVMYSYNIGRGVGVEQRGARRLDDGVLPILRTTMFDEEVSYNTATFVTLESSPLNGQTPIGTHYLVADHYSSGGMFTKGQQEQLKPLLAADSMKTEETVLYVRADAVNNGKVPRYAYFKTIKPGYAWWQRTPYFFNSSNGFTTLSNGLVLAVSRLNGKPLHDEEIAVLLQPGEKAVFEFCLPHNPLPMERAVKLSQQSFDSRYEECRSFWYGKLSRSAAIKVPEKRIQEMIYAGLCHLDLITYGNEPSGTLAPCIGVYSPIGTESAPIIQFYNSMGLNDQARRSLQYFLDKQHEDGMIQNFGGYMVETGAALWCIGEYFRYTNDVEWIKSIKPKLLKSCEYLIKWREQNLSESLRGKGYGMIAGKVADPDDQYHQYMLNAYAYLGIKRVAEMLAGIDPSASKKMAAMAATWKENILSSLKRSLAYSPVIPMSNGAWVPTLPPWPETAGPQMLYIDSARNFSHGSFTVKDALIGPLYLVFCEVLEPNDPISRMLLNYHTELLFMKNVAFSQPYYTRNDWLQLKLGMVKPFLKTYYNTFPAISDRQTYTFYEHLHQVSIHKTHEEGWFLMQTRWMLYMEDGPVLRLLPGVPRDWLKDGDVISVINGGSYYGNISFSVASSARQNFIDVSVECNSKRMPKAVTVRIPHPDGRRPVKVSSGIFDNATETLTIKPFTGSANIHLDY